MPQLSGLRRPIKIVKPKKSNKPVKGRTSNKQVLKTRKGSKKIERFNTHFSDLNKQYPSKFIFCSTNTTPLDKIVVGTVSETFPDLTTNFQKILAHNFQEAEINGHGVVKGPFMYNTTAELVAHDADFRDFFDLFQLLVPGDLTLIPLLVEPLKLEAVTTLAKKIRGLEKLNQLERMNSLNNIILEAMKVEGIVAKLQEIATTSLTLFSTLTSFNVPTTMGNLPTIYKKIEQLLNSWKDNVTKYNIRLPLDTGTFGFKTRDRIISSSRSLFQTLTYALLALKGIILVHDTSNFTTISFACLDMAKLLNKNIEKMVYIRRVNIDSTFEYYTLMA
jgi:hypothetical protein